MPKITLGFPGGTDDLSTLALHWKLLHPGMKVRHLGFLPLIFRKDDPRIAQKQANDRYAHGGGWLSLPHYTLDLVTHELTWQDKSIAPDAPEVLGKPFAELELQTQKLLLYQHAFCVALESTGIFDVARID